MAKKGNLWIQRKLATAELKTVEGVNRYVGKASTKFDSMSVHKQAQTYLKIIKVPGVKFMMSLHDKLLNGMVLDYKVDNEREKIGVEEWLQKYRDDTQNILLEM